MKNKIFNKILSENKQFELMRVENEKLKNINSKLIKENNKTKDSNRILKIQNKQLAEKNKKLKKDIEKIDKSTSFINFQEFLANSYVSPIINAPFSSEDKRVFAFMDHLSKYLIKKTAKFKSKPLVSIIMPVYNGENAIQNAMASVFKQSYENWELIIIDDGSTDNTLNMVNKVAYDKIKILSHDNPKGFAFSCNEALNEATGEYIMYLDSNNAWDSRYIETMVGAFIELGDADALYSGQYLYKEHDSKPYAVRFGSLNKSLLHNKNYIDISCFCHKKHVFEEFDENLSQLMVWDFILKITNEYKVYSVPVLLSKFYQSTSLINVSGISTDYYDEASKILEKNSIHPKTYKKLSHKLSIIIPSFESLIELKMCIEAILSFDLSDMVDIIVVDNNSRIEVKEYLKTLDSQNIKLIFNDINYGFTYSVMQAIELSDESSDLLLLNNDAVLTEGAIEHMQTGAYYYKDCGLIVPHELVSEKNPHMNYHVPYADPEFKCDVTPSKIHHNIINMPIFHDGGLIELNFAPFFCVYIKRDVYNKTLGLDPELGRHYRSDRIFSDFIRHILKMKIYQEPNAYVYHKHKAATNALKNDKKEYDYMFNKNQWTPELAKKLGYEKALWD